MSAPGIARLECLGLEAGLAREVQARLAAAFAALDLGGIFAGVVLCADDEQVGEEAWFRVAAAPGGGLPLLTLYCPPTAFCRRPDIRTTTYPVPGIWESGPVAGEPLTPAVADFSSARSEAFLHHQLLLAADLRTGAVVPAAIPPSQAEGFGAAWAVTLDGRLARRRLPGYSLPERRGIFSRRFSSAGVLMPGHWQVFQALWDGALASADEVLGAVRQLPRL